MVYLGLGSNIGNRIEYIRYALRQLQEDIIQDMEVASIYVTEALEYVEQPKFLNTVCRGKTKYVPKKLLNLCQNIEKEAGRIRDISKGPRTLDIDILLYNDTVIQDMELTIPHPEIQNRRFVLLPLLELDPVCRAPDSKKRYDSYLEHTKTQEVIPWSYKQ